MCPALPVRCRLLVFLALLLGRLSSAQTEPQISKVTPSKPAEQAAKAEEKKEKPEPPASTIESLESKIRFEDDGNSRSEVTLRAKIQSESAVRENGVIVFPYSASFEKFTVQYVRVRKPTGEVITTDLAAMQDMTSEVSRSAPMYTDEREKHIAVQGLSAGDELEYQITRSSSQPVVPGQFWFEYRFFKNIVVLSQQLEIDVPRNRQIKLLSPDFKPEISETSDRRIYKIHSSNPTIPPEQDKWELALKGVPAPDVQITSFRDWNEVAAWYSSLVEPRIKVTPEIRAKADELTKGQTTEAGKIAALYNYVSHNFRYIGISLGAGRYTPHSAGEILVNQFGDCKDKHTLFAALLEAQGIYAKTVLIGTEAKISKDFPTPGPFDHVITAISRPENSPAPLLWLDTTPEVAPFGYLSAEIRDRLALVIDQNGKGSLEETPALPPYKLQQKFSIDAKLDSVGTLDGKAHFELRDDSEIIYRKAFRNTAKEKWTQLAQNIVNGMGFAGTVDDVVVSSVDNTTNPFSMDYTYHLTEYGDWPNHQIILPFPFIALATLTDKEAESRAGLLLAPPTEIVFEARLKLPDGFYPYVGPEVKSKNGFAQYDSVTSFEDGVLTGKRTIRYLEREVPAGKRPDYIAFEKTIVTDETRWIFLTSADSGASAEAKDAEFRNEKGKKSFDEGMQAYNMGTPLAAIKALEQAVAIEPTWSQAWLALGAARQMHGDNDDAISAYRKGLENDPANEFAYRGLADALTNAKRFAEAAAVFRSLLKLKPDDPIAHNKLSDLLLKTGNYKEATAIIEKSDNGGGLSPGSEFRLGDAYIHLGDEEKAMDHFEKAIKLGPKGPLETAIASSMANANRRVPDALKFAQEAVAEYEATTTRVLADRSEGTKMALMSRLADAWSVLGDIEMQSGDLQAAERYLNASWNLTHAPATGEKLAQAYEKNGKKLEASRTYALALASMSMADDTKLRGRLLARVQSKAPANRGWSNPTLELKTEHVVKFKSSQELAAYGSFMMTLSNDSTRQRAKWDTGKRELQALEPTLAVLQFHFPFPDDSPTQIFFRATVTCGKLNCELERPNIWSNKPSIDGYEVFD